ncbi:hypothetical protein [Amycolatopsis thermophila]|uniref:Uncharacterized protein n=1 Tax=Amycolatopsis thermophila TaxID=206084 RepID=A0ABU0ENH6_9PSEU|nr:hypothetical protein [Amycolatopsis thermophila]MDQ0376598.1 hypothetical protein [Amycolatopsis thermophila]
MNQPHTSAETLAADWAHLASALNTRIRDFDTYTAPIRATEPEPDTDTDPDDDPTYQADDTGVTRHLKYGVILPALQDAKDAINLVVGMLMQKSFEDQQAAARQQQLASSYPNHPHYQPQ